MLIWLEFPKLPRYRCQGGPGGYAGLCFSAESPEFLTLRCVKDEQSPVIQEKGFPGCSGGRLTLGGAVGFLRRGLVFVLMVMVLWLPICTAFALEIQTAEFPLESRTGVSPLHNPSKLSLEEEIGV